MPKKSLLIALGSTGQRIVDGVLRRVHWEYGGQQNTPWVRVLNLETDARGRGEYIRDEDMLILKVDDAQKSALIQQPENYALSMDLPAWMDRATFNIPGALNGTGAGNIRMFGRLGFLFPDNFVGRDGRPGLVGMLRQRLLDLQRLQVCDDVRSVKPDGAMEQITFPPDDPLTVYVIGTLCGGTAGGCGVDFGYLLRRLANDLNFGAQLLIRNGIFTIPAVGEANEVRKQNAYAALMELNHFHGSDAKPYEAIFPDEPGHKFTAPSEKPYDYVFLTQPRQPTQEAERLLNDSLAQYLYTDIFLGHTQAVVAARSNVGLNLINTDRKGAPESYLTLGISSLEFPAQQVMEGCTARLLKGMFDRWLTPYKESAPGELITRVRESLGLTEEQIRGTLLRLEGADALSLRERLARKVEESQRNAERAMGPGPLTSAQQKLNLAFQHQPIEGMDAYPDVPLNSVIEQLSRNEQATRREMNSALNTLIRDALLDPARGVDFAKQVVRVVQELVDGLRQNMTQMDADGFTPAQSRQHLREEALKGARDEFGKASQKRFFRTSAQKRALLRWGNELRELFMARLDAQAELVAARLLGDFSLRLQQMTRRLERIEKLGRTLREHFAALEEERDSRVPQMSGKVLFYLRQTLDREYQNALHAYATERPGFIAAVPGVTLWQACEQRAQGEVLRAWSPVMDESLAEGTQTFFDERPDDPAEVRFNEPRPSDVQLLMGTGRGYFQSLLNYDALAAASADDLQQTAESANLFLRLDTSHMRHNPGGNKAYSFVVSTRDPINVFNYTALGYLYAPIPHEPYRVTFLRERGGFSLPIVAGCATADDLAHDGSFRRAYEDFYSASPNRTLHSRTDIAWIPLEGLDKGEQNVKEGRVIVGWACGVLDVVLRPRTLFHLRVPPTGPGDTGDRYLPWGLKAAADAIEQQGLASEIDRRLRENLDVNGPAHVLKQFDTFMAKYYTVPPGTDPETWVSEELGRAFPPRGEVVERLQDYAEHDARLKELWVQTYGAQTVNPQTLFRKADGKLYPADGYYCHNPTPAGVCLQPLNDESGEPMTRCPKCGKVYRFA